MTDEFEWQASLVESDLLHLIKNPRDALKGEKLDPKTSLQLWAIGDLLDQHIDTDESVDSLGNRLLPVAINGDINYALWPDYWEQLKKEFQIFLCTKDKKYDTLRKKLATSADKSHTMIVSTIAAAMAVHFGVTAGVLVSFCAMCLLVVVRMGKEAFCATWK